MRFVRSFAPRVVFACAGLLSIAVLPARAQWVSCTGTSGECLSSGSVGVGTTTPAATLNVAASGSTNPFAITTSGHPLVTVTPTANVQVGNTTQSGLLTLKAAGSSAVPLVQLEANLGSYSVVGAGSYLSFLNTYNSAEVGRISDVLTQTTGVGMGFSTLYESTPGLEQAMFLAGNGRMSVGLSQTPASQLEVNAGCAAPCPWQPSNHAWYASGVLPPQALTITNTSPGGNDPVIVGQMATTSGATKPAFAIGAVAEQGWTDGTLSTQVDSVYFINRDGAGNLQERMRITSAGNVGIGTTSPQHLLSVAGTIAAQEVVVVSSGADYVFDKGYRLAPLEEVASYIDANHHLPDLPSASEVQEKGLSVGDMQAKLLAKVEELTLHMIQEHERSDRLERENRELRERLARLEGKK